MCLDNSNEKLMDIMRQCLNVPMAAVCFFKDVQGHKDAPLGGARRQSLNDFAGVPLAETPTPATQNRFYVTLPQGTDVYVIENCRSDSRLQHSTFVTGPPYIRFYAGVALFVNGVHEGTLFVADHTARTNFSGNDIRMLEDFGKAVSAVLQDRADVLTASNRARYGVRGEG